MVKDLNFDIKVIGCPIIREADGLAKSSRNTYLNTEERKAAVVLSKALQIGKIAIEDGEKSAIVIGTLIRNQIQQEKLAKIEYIEIVNWNTFEPMDYIEGSILVAIAVYIGKTRLIDNFCKW